MQCFYLLQEHGLLPADAIMHSKQPSLHKGLCCAPAGAALPHLQAADLAGAASAHLGIWACQPTTAHTIAQLSATKSHDKIALIIRDEL